MVPKYNVIAHRRAHKFMSELKNENLKNIMKNTLTKLENYPITLRELHIEKIKSLDRTFRIRGDGAAFWKNEGGG